MFINDILSSIMLTLNSTLGKPNFKPLDELINDNFNKGFVKSVQSGLYNNPSIDEDVLVKEITINDVNMNKCIVIVDTIEGARPTSGYLTSNNKLALYRTDSGSGAGGKYSIFSNIRWQVIEFY